MTPTKFDEMVANLANTRVQDRIRVFRDDVGLALKKLYGHHCYTYHPDAKRAFAMLADECRTLKGDIWAQEKEAVAEEILDTMNVVQQAMLAKPDPDGPREAEAKGEDDDA